MKKVKVFLVEHDEDELFFMKKGFESIGLFDVMSAVCDTNELFELLNNSREALPDLIISDMNMPRKNGIDIVKAIQSDSFFSHIRIVIVSISAVKQFMQQTLDAGAYAYFVKPETFNDYAPFARMIYSSILFASGK